MKLLSIAISANRKLVRFFTKDFRLNSEFEVLIAHYASMSKKILEIGGSNRPLLKLTENYLIVGCDIDKTKDYSNCYNEFHLGEINTMPHKDFDLIYSSYLMEHVADAKEMYNVQFQKISGFGGRIVHVYPLGYHPYSIVTKIADKLNLTRKLIKILRPEAYLISGYKTYFNLGNIYDLENFLKNHPFVADYTLKYAYSGSDYFAALAPLGLAIELFNRICEIFELRFFASNVIVDITIDKSAFQMRC